MSAAHAPISPRTIIEAFLPMAGTTNLDIVYDAAAAAGVGDQPLRLALRRMAAAGEIEVSGRGRKGIAGVTELGRARLHRDRRGLRLALAQDDRAVTWDGSWQLLAVSAPEVHRSERDALRRDLADAGAVSVSTSLFVTPHDLSELLGQAHQASLVLATATHVDIRGESDPIAITEMLWPPELALAGYRRLAHVLECSGPERAHSPEDVLVAQLHLAEALEQALRPDPLIPPELRARPWPATEIRQAWLATWTELAARDPTRALYQGWLR